MEHATGLDNTRLMDKPDVRLNPLVLQILTYHLSHEISGTRNLGNLSFFFYETSVAVIRHELHPALGWSFVYRVSMSAFALLKT